MEKFVLSYEGKKYLRSLIEDVVSNNPSVKSSFPDAYVSYVSQVVVDNICDDIVRDLVGKVKTCGETTKRFIVTPYRYNDGNKCSMTGITNLKKTYDTIEEAVESAMTIFSRVDVDAVQVNDIYTCGCKLDIKK